MTCSGKRQVSTIWITGRSICFSEKCTWNVLVIKGTIMQNENENHFICSSS